MFGCTPQWTCLHKPDRTLRANYCRAAEWGHFGKCSKIGKGYGVLYATYVCCPFSRWVYEGANRTWCIWKSSQGRTILEIGPFLQTELRKALVQERMHPVVVTRNLQKTFLQVRIQDSKRDVLQLHWRDDEHSELCVLHFTRALFGVGSKSVLARRSNWDVFEVMGAAQHHCERAAQDIAWLVERSAYKGPSKWNSNVPQLESEESLRECDHTYAKQQIGDCWWGSDKLSLGCHGTKVKILSLL